MLQEQGLEPTAEQIASFRALVDQLNSGEVTVGPQKAAVIGMSGKLVEEIGLHLFRRGWRIYQTPEMLLTCDEPVVPILGPPHSRTEFGGVGNAGVVIFPLTPGLLLAMFDGFRARPAEPHELGYRDVGDLNREIAAAATAYAFERPANNIGSGLKLPKAPELVCREAPVPVGDQGEDYLIRSYRPSRWANAKRPPPWPVKRWFRPAA